MDRKNQTGYWKLTIFVPFNISIYPSRWHEINSSTLSVVCATIAGSGRKIFYRPIKYTIKKEIKTRQQEINKGQTRNSDGLMKFDKDTNAQENKCGWNRMAIDWRKWIRIERNIFASFSWCGWIGRFC